MTNKERPTQLEMVFDKGGRLTATLMWDKAPKTCEGIVNTLKKHGPYTARLLHAQYAGSEVYFENFPVEGQLPFENTTLRMDENMFVTNKIDGGVLAFYVNPKILSFCIVYGTLIPRRTADVEIALNMFAEIDDKEEARRIGDRARWEGPGSVTVKILD